MYLQKWGWINWWWYNRRRVTANDGNNFISHNFKAGMEPHNNIVGKDSGRALEKYEELCVLHESMSPWFGSFKFRFITCQQPFLNSESTNLFHKIFFAFLKGIWNVFICKIISYIFVYFDLDWKLLSCRKTFKNLGEKLVDSEFKIACWHVMNWL